MTLVNDSKQPRHDLLLSVGVYLRVAQHGQRVAELVPERHQRLAALQNGVSGEGRDGQHDGDRHGHPLGRHGLEVQEVRGSLVDGLAACEVEGVHQQRVEVEGLQQRALPHEALQRGGPALAHRLQPVHVDVGQQGRGKRVHLLQPPPGLLGRQQQVHNFVSVGVGQAVGQRGSAHQHALSHQRAQDHVHGLLHRHAVRGQHDLGVQGRLIGIVHACEALQLSCRHLGIEALGVALLHHRQRHVHEHLQELQTLLLVPLPHGVPVRQVRGHQRHDGDGARVREQARQLAYSTHTFAAIRLGEPQVSV
mmetsp:Transcript_23237/g.31826  ORF Transcript_23237/g.31826 Transcript_23237/m.31826 type:complete len:307 (+) Transcript_23237:1228-2148(+)